MNKFTIGFIVLILLGGVLYPFRGIFPPFYYAQFNDVRDRLHEIEGLEIKDYWQHKDMRLEDCGFDVEIGGRQVSLTFSDNQDWVGLFDEFDGIYMSKPDQQLVISREQMNAAGLQIKGLEDLLQNLEAVFKFCSKDAVPKIIENIDCKYEDFLGYALIKI
tara:strand:- start:172 stop:654 length:483 start_codon:yes stop_codon:yes gene_type:complete